MGPLTKRMAVMAASAAMLLTSGGCGSGKGPEVIGSEEMARLIVDMQLADAFVMDQSLGIFSADSVRIAMRMAVLAKHSVSEAQLDSSYRYYGRHLSTLLKIYDRADAMLADSLAALEHEEHMLRASAAGDSVDVWPSAPSVVMASTGLSEFFSVRIEADSTWLRGDQIIWEMSLDNARSPLYASLTVSYLGSERKMESVTGEILPNASVRRLTLAVQTDSNVSIGSVIGYLRMPLAGGERAFVDSIRMVRTRLVGEDYNYRRRNLKTLRRNGY